MATKNDKPQIDFNLDKLEAPEEFRSHRFVFRGKPFETVDPKEIAYMDIIDTYEANDNRRMMDLFLGEQAEQFWKLKPGILHVQAFVEALEPVLRTIVGEPGEASDSEA